MGLATSSPKRAERIAPPSPGIAPTAARSRERSSSKLRQYRIICVALQAMPALDFINAGSCCRHIQATRGVQNPIGHLFNLLNRVQLRSGALSSEPVSPMTDTRLKKHRSKPCPQGAAEAKRLRSPLHCCVTSSLLACQVPNFLFPERAPFKAQESS